MYFCGIITGRMLVCLYAGNKGNFIIIGKGNSFDTFEVVSNPMSDEDARDICIQEDVEISKMMLEMHLAGKIGEAYNIVGSEEEIMTTLGNTHEIETAISSLKKLNADTLRRTTHE